MILTLHNTQESKLTRTGGVAKRRAEGANRAQQAARERRVPESQPKASVRELGRRVNRDWDPACERPGRKRIGKRANWSETEWKPAKSQLRKTETVGTTAG